MLIPVRLSCAPSVMVLCYHTFYGNPSNEFDFSLRELETHCDQLTNAGYRFTSLGAIASNSVSADKQILITVDDGHKTLASDWTQVFAPRHIRPVLGIYPGITSRASFALTWTQLSNLSANADIACHGLYHDYLYEEHYENNRKDFLNEIYKARDIISNALGRRPDVYVYPFGISCATARFHLKRA